MLPELGVLAMLLLPAFAPVSSGAIPGPVIITVQGMLVYADLHNTQSNPVWALSTDEGKIIPLDTTTFNPPPEVHVGAYLQVTGELWYDGICRPASYERYVCSGFGLCMWTSSWTRDPYSRDDQPNNPSTPTSPVANSPQLLLVMVLDYSACGYPASVNTSTIRSIFLGPNGDGTAGIAQKYSQCSYGTFGIDASKFRAEVVVPQSCNTAAQTLQTCKWWNIANDADTAAKSLIGSDKYGEFTHYAYVLPPGLETVCNWTRGGMSLLPGRKIWLQTSSQGLNRSATIMHMTLHNYGLWHSWKDGYELADYSSVMGSGDACPSAAETSRLGWATPAATISSATLPAKGTWRSFTLPASYLTGTANHLRLTPNWLAKYNKTNAKNLYIDVRVAKGGDQGLGGTYAPKLNVHEVNAELDNNYVTPKQYPFGYWPPTDGFSDRKVSLVSAVSAAARAELTAYNLVITSGSWTSTDNLQISLCRYSASPTECKVPSPSPSPPSPKQSAPSPRPPTPSPRPPSPRPPTPSPRPPSPRPPTPSPRPPSPRPPTPSPRPPSPRPPTPSPRPPSPRPSPPARRPMPPPPSPKPIVQTVKGRLSTVIDVVDGLEQLVVRTTDIELVPIDMPTFRALNPYEDYKPWDYIILDCVMKSGGVCFPTSYLVFSCSAFGICSWSGDNSFGDYGPGDFPNDLKPESLANYMERFLVMVLDYSACGYPAALNGSSTRDLFLGFARNAELCSNGKFGLDQGALQALVVRPNCSAATTTSCAWWTMANEANSVAKSILGDNTFKGFTHYAYVLPPGLETVCNWTRGGLSLLPGNQIWLQTAAESVYRWEVLLHMNLHNYGLWHSWEDGKEFADGSTALGGGVACPNAAESSRLGWANPVSGGEAINSIQLPPGAVQSYTVASARTAGGDGSFLRVMPDWRPDYYEDPDNFFLFNTDTATNLYIEVRIAGYDPEVLDEAYAPKINVYEVNAAMDNGYLHYVPPIGNWALEFEHTDRKIQIISKIPFSHRVILTDYNLVVYGRSIASESTMEVQLCRFVTSDAECQASP